MKYLVAALMLPLAVFIVALASSDISTAAQAGTTRGDFVQCLNIQNALIEEAPECGIEVPLESTNSVATLFASGDRPTANVIDRHLEANNAYTLWWVTFNDPSGCIDGCGGADVFAELESAQVVLMNATGGTSTHLGNLVVSAWIEADGTSSGSGQLLAGELASLDLDAAEVHIIRSHRPASEDADILEKQLQTVDGGCLGIDPDGDELFPCWDPHAVQFAP